MKNFLTTLISFFVTILIIIFMVKGFSIGNIQVLSISQIMENSHELDVEIENVNNLKNVTYKKALSDLETSTKALTKSKQEYLDLASVSSDRDIKNANLQQTYSMEYLWSKVGNYATQEGVNLKFELNSTGTENINTINFTVTGSYIGITNYIYRLENDTDLAFRIENFKIVSGSSEEQLSATFSTSNIGIKAEEVSRKPETSQNTNETMNNTENTSTTTNETETTTNTDENTTQEN